MNIKYLSEEQILTNIMTKDNVAAGDGEREEEKKERTESHVSVHQNIPKKIIIY